MLSLNADLFCRESVQSPAKLTGTIKTGELTEMRTYVSHRGKDISLLSQVQVRLTLHRVIQKNLFLYTLIYPYIHTDNILDKMTFVVNEQKDVNIFTDIRYMDCKKIC